MGPGFLKDIDIAEVLGGLQRIDRFATGIQFSLDQHRLGINSFDGFDVIFIGSAVCGFILEMSRVGIGDIIRSHRGAVAPMCGRFDLEGDLSHLIVPCIIPIRQQRIHLAIEHIVHVRGFEHGELNHVVVAVVTNGHGVIHVGGVRIPTDNRTPLKTIEVQGFLSGKHYPRCFRRDLDGFDDGLGFHDHLGFLDHLGLHDRYFNGLDNGLWCSCCAGSQHQPHHHKQGYYDIQAFHFDSP